MLFRPKPPVDAEEWEWQLAAFKWLEREYPELAEARILATPDGECFPDPTCKGEQRGSELFDQIKDIAGIADWPTRLIAVDTPKRGGAVNSVAAIQSSKAACGTFQLQKTPEGVWIGEVRYTIDQLADEQALVATFAHEAAHFLLAFAQNPLPGGDDIEELLTDLTAVWLGFGTFLGNHARYGHHSSDAGGTWYVSGSRGYLGERSLMTALALSEILAGRDPLAADRYLKPYLVDDLRLATRYAQKRDLSAEMAAIDLEDFGA